jgi:hypothetical protein
MRCVADKWCHDACAEEAFLQYRCGSRPGFSLGEEMRHLRINTTIRSLIYLHEDAGTYHYSNPSQKKHVGGYISWPLENEMGSR